MDLKDKLDSLSRDYESLVKNRDSDTCMTNIDHIARNVLNILSGNMQLIEEGIESGIKEEDLKELVCDLENYFRLIKENPEFAKEEINGKGYFENVDRSDEQRYIRHAVRHFNL